MALQIRPEAAWLPVYRPGRRPAEISGRPAYKLSSNENPYPPLPGVLAAATAACEELNRYPDLGVTRLTTVLARRLGVEPAQIAFGTGSVAVLFHLLSVLGRPGSEVVYAFRSFEAYPIATQLSGAIGVPVPLNREYEHDLDAMLAAITPATVAVLLCTPNNPTGPTLRQADVEAFLDQVPPDVAVVIDEAYVEFVDDPTAVSGLTLLDRPQVVVLRTFSKAYGLAGLRVGYAIAHPEVADLMNRVRQPFNVSSVALAAAEAALADDEFLAQSAELNRRGMVQLTEAFGALGLEWIPSAGNFVTFKVGDAAGVNRALQQQGVIVRPIAGYGMPHWLRVSIGLPEENERFIAALGRALG